MIKIYCDQCGKEGARYSMDKLIMEFKKIKVEIIVAVNNVWNDGHVCEDCIREVASKGRRA